MSDITHLNDFKRDKKNDLLIKKIDIYVIKQALETALKDIMTVERIDTKGIRKDLYRHIVRMRQIIDSLEKKEL
jgi:hypothetical protein